MIDAYNNIWRALRKGDNLEIVVMLIAFIEKDGYEKGWSKFPHTGNSYIDEKIDLANGFLTGDIQELWPKIRMSLEGFEALIDRLYPANVDMRKGNIDLPARLRQLTEYLFINEAVGTKSERQAIRNQLINLSKGAFVFDSIKEGK